MRPEGVPGERNESREAKSNGMPAAISSPHRKLTGQAHYGRGIQCNLSCLFIHARLRRLTPPIIWGRSFCGQAELRLVECIKMVLDNHPVAGHSLRHWGVMNLVNPLKSCHYFGMILQFKGRSLYQIVAKNYFGQMCLLLEELCFLNFKNVVMQLLDSWS